MTIQKCTIDNCKYLAGLNKELINAEGSDNPMMVEELEERMKDFLQTSYEAFFFIEQDVVVGYALVKMDCEPLYLRQFMIIRECRRRHYGEEAFRLLLSYLKADSIDIEVLSNNHKGVQFWEKMGFVERHKYMQYKGKSGVNMIPAEDIIPIVKNTIAASIKSNTQRGYIGWSGCDNICMDMHDCLDMCVENLKSGDYMTALKASVYILLSGVKLASYADSSSGMLTDVILSTYDLIDKCTKEIEKKDKKMRDEALGLIIKEARKKVFDGWTDWRYDLLKCGICLCDVNNAKKFERVLDTLLESTQEDYFSEYKEKEDIIARYLLHRHLYGKENTKKELYQNITVKELCIIAIRDAVEDENYDEAETLCLEKAKEAQAWHYRSSDPEDWNNMLYDIYKTANNTEKQIAQAKKLLLMGNKKFWDVLKQIYNESGVWNENYKALLDELKGSKQTICYRSILVDENERERLLEDVIKNPFDLFYYGKYLVKDYPEQIYELCYKEISENCAQAKDRREYKKVTKQISQLIKWKGVDKARELIEELKRTYPRRPALLDELQKVEKKL